MKTIKELLKLHPETHRAHPYGVEIEVEGKNLPQNLSPLVWRVEKDDSLKTLEAWEYVTPNPLSLEGIRSSLNYLATAYKDNKSVVDESIRAGVHVHMNVQDWNIKQLFTFATAYYIIEDLLSRWCGPGREGNHFCLRTKDAEYVLFRVLNALQQRNLSYLQEDIIRYSALNYCSLFKYGSIEFRGMRGTGDLDTIYNWVEIINDLRHSSQKFDSPVEVVSTMSGDGGAGFLQRLLPNTYKYFDNLEGIDELVSKSTRRVQMLAFGVDWDNMDKKSANPFLQSEW